MVVNACEILTHLCLPNLSTHGKKNTYLDRIGLLMGNIMQRGNFGCYHILWAKAAYKD